jgi:hypothetical protein
MDGGKKLNLAGAFVRMLWSAFLIFAAYNTTGYSYWHWFWAAVPDAAHTDLEWMLKISVGATMAIGFYSAVDTTRRSLHLPGFLLAIIACAGASAFLVDAGWVILETADDVMLAVQMTGIAVLTIGLCFSHLHYRIGGVKQIEET